MTEPTHVIDTNVLIAANGRADQATIDCQIACIDLLTKVRDGSLLALDGEGEILEEYSRYCHYLGEPGVGDQFYRWAVDNQYAACMRVDLANHPERKYELFPDSADLVGFDQSDRKFVATALGCPPPTLICNAVDSDWSEYGQALLDAGVEVRELCPDCLKKH